MACAQALKLDINKLNVNGGAIALGHPLAASGSRITAHLVHELKYVHFLLYFHDLLQKIIILFVDFRRRGLKRGIGSACIGGGQGIALLIEV